MQDFQRVKDGKTVYEITPEEFAENVKIMAKKGASILGGCCGTDDRYIKRVVEALKDLKPVEIIDKKLTAVCSSSKTVVLGREVKLIGERINPTGKKKFKEALKNNNMDYILGEAVSQVEAGADILDVNVGTSRNR
jgi:5-methyltetrahydrofolate--homocysteine methyltransferase